MPRRFPQVSAMSNVIDAMLERFPQVLDPAAAISDGPALMSDDVDQLLQVGVDDPDTSSGAASNSATSTISWAGLGDLARDELLVIRLVASAKSGDTTGGMRIARDKAFSMVEACQWELVRDRNAPIIGGAVYAWVTEISMQQQQNPNGAFCDVMFSVQCRVRIERGYNQQCV